MNAIESVEDVAAVATRLGMRELRFQPPLFGAWWLPDVELVTSTQGWGLSIGLIARIPGAPSDLWRWRANVSGGIDPEDLAALIRAASRRETKAAS